MLAKVRSEKFLSTVLIAFSILTCALATFVHAQSAITMGENTILSQIGYNNSGFVLVQNTSLADTATIQNISMYATLPAGQVRLGVYDATGPNDGPGQLKAQTNAFTPVTGWNTQPVITPVAIPRGNYWIAFSTTDNTLQQPSITGRTTDHVQVTPYAFGPMPATYPAPSSTGNQHWSIYVILTPGGTVPPPAPPPTTPPPTPPTPPTPPPPLGTWTNVTPSNVNLVNSLDCGNFGTQSVVADPARPSNLYTLFHCQGIWISTDYGLTWTGPINTGTHGALAGDCAGGIAIAPGGGSNPPILYESCVRGSTGFWRSLNGGVSWTRYNVAPGTNQLFYPPSVDPYDSNHLIMPGAANSIIVQSFDGGQTWSMIPMDPGMVTISNSSAAGLFFINTGNAATTRKTFLFIEQMGGANGTWRTTDGGATWTIVDGNQHPHAVSQIYQPDNNGVVYMAGVYSKLGWGVLRSTDYGQTWAHVGIVTTSGIVFGTPNNIYAAWTVGQLDPNLVSAPQPGLTGWASIPTPAGMTSGLGGAAVVFDGQYYVVVTANWQGGLWRHVEGGTASHRRLRFHQ